MKLAVEPKISIAARWKRFVERSSFKEVDSDAAKNRNKDEANLVNINNEESSADCTRLVLDVTSMGEEASLANTRGVENLVSSEEASLGNNSLVNKGENPDNNAGASAGATVSRNAVASLASKDEKANGRNNDSNVTRLNNAAALESLANSSNNAHGKSNNVEVKND